MIQSILDLYPDVVSQYGLVGCIYVTFIVPLAVWAVCYVARRVFS
jgi:hypothetical protein